MLADEMYRISSASLPQPSPRSQFISIVVIGNLDDRQDKHENDNLKGLKGEACKSAEQSDTGAKPAKIAFAIGGETLSFFDRGEMKAHAVVRAELSKQWQIDGDDIRDPGITARRLMICHQDYQLSVGQ